MRGQPVSRELKKIDGVLLAAHWDGETLVALRLAERRGVVWGDAALSTPEEVMARIRAGASIHLATAGDLPGDFQVGERVEIRNDTLMIAGKPLSTAMKALPVY